MSRFLHHLGARAVGQAGIAPRAQSLFEPASASAPERAGIGATVPPARQLRDTGETRTHVTASPLRMPSPRAREPVRPQAAVLGELPRSPAAQRPHFERRAVTARTGKAPGEQATAETTTEKDDGEHL